MGELNLPRQERDALKAIDAVKLREAIQKCVEQRYSTDLAPFQLYNCGLYVSNKLAYFERALADYRGAKAPKKTADTLYAAEKMGRDLVSAVQQMHSRLQQDEEDEQFFRIDDLIIPPSWLNEQLSVRVRYQWRKGSEGSWTHGDIVFSHDVDPRPDYATLQPKRKPSAAQQERARQEKLYEQWSHLMRLSLYSVRDFFKDGGDGAKIPASFQARPDAYSGGLNNHSAKFWHDQN